LSLAGPEGYVRLFVDEGEPMAQLLVQLPSTPYHDKILAAFSGAEAQGSWGAGEKISSPAPQLPRSSALIEPLSERELEVLQLIAQGLSNREISERLFLALSTVKGHNRLIFGKLQVQRRTEAVARARELGLL
ncbi:MAG: LuxR family transcriptional regulator, partial [Anaerolineae bacterium]|nr:LuxR family transcriptional regulator [Anaerolineae bacterium]